MPHPLEIETIALIEKNELSEDNFNAHALKVFKAQYDGIPAYKKLCDGRDKTPDNITHYTEIPSVPTDVFKHVSLFWGGEIKRTFQTSGTTQGLRGQHHFNSLELYNASMEAPFQKFILQNKSLPFLILAPSGTDTPDSSLSYMLSRMADQYASTSSYFVNPRDGELELQLEVLADAFTKLVDSDQPAAILGTAFAFIAFFDRFPNQKWKLPHGSVVMETGGLKGRTREVSRPDFYNMIENQLGIPKQKIVSEYSMTELSSQSYTNSLADNLPWQSALYQTPPWARIDLVDPKTMKVDNTLERGLIRWFDLANLYSVSAILTSDIGSLGANGFRLHGRASDAQLRGCSLSIEEILA